METGKLIYVASPYTHSDIEVRNKRNEDVARAMGYLMNTYPNLCFFSPICHAHPIATLCSLPGNWEYWEYQDETMLSHCQELWILCLEDVETSKGVLSELNLAKKMGIEVRYIYPQTDGTYIVAFFGFGSPEVR